MTESLPLDNFQNMIDDEIADQQRKFDLISSTNNETLNIGQTKLKRIYLPGKRKVLELKCVSSPA